MLVAAHQELPTPSASQSNTALVSSLIYSYQDARNINMKFSDINPVKLSWDNLKRNACPKCGKELQESSYNERLYCLDSHVCRFSVAKEKAREIVENIMVRAAERDRRQREKDQDTDREFDERLLREKLTGDDAPPPDDEDYSDLPF